MATRARELAAQQLTQARDRFAAGVASNIEVVQAQEAVALANEQYIAALYCYNVGEGRAGPRSRRSGSRPCVSISEASADGRASSADFTGQPRFRMLDRRRRSRRRRRRRLAVLTAGRESTDDAQVDAHVTPIAARVGGTVLRVPVKDNQLVEAGAVLVEIDPRDYQIAVDKARAELADAEAAAHGGAEQRADHLDDRGEQREHGAERRSNRRTRRSTRPQKEVEPRGRGSTAAQARLREAEANATQAGARRRAAAGAARQGRGLAAAVRRRGRGRRGAARGRSTRPRRQVVEAEAGIRVGREPASCRRAPAEQQARGGLRTRADRRPSRSRPCARAPRAAEAHAQQAQRDARAGRAESRSTPTVKAPGQGRRQPQDASKSARSFSPASR